ncbi:hypothetical protein HZS93_01755 [Xanthomonas citri]|nr:hypothetical protein HZS93_01755 [Xanthomonas citri]CEE24072.1 membrane hypothetical protein [Xanthomonas citri pv. citri]CEE75265.1 membrane hypothetical protein [Xanthomonas citri pv. citri]CEF44716.1 membrane hypothetical protein [Xanthomonas citri pv. citri]
MGGAAALRRRRVEEEQRMTILDRPAGRGHWALATLGGVIALLGAVLLAGGVWLAALGGSWYYAPAGAAMLVAGVLLFRGRNAGAWWFAGVVAVSLLWTWWESGSDYWRWVPRLGLIVGLALVLALLLPKLQRPVSRTVSRSLAGALAVVFVVAFALAFMPHGVTEADRAGACGRRARGPGHPRHIRPGCGVWRAAGECTCRRRLGRVRTQPGRPTLFAAAADQSRQCDAAAASLAFPHRRFAEQALGCGNHAAEGGRQPVSVHCAQPGDSAGCRQRQAALALRSQGQGRGDPVHGGMPWRLVLRSTGGCRRCGCWSNDSAMPHARDRRHARRALDCAGRTQRHAVPGFRQQRSGGYHRRYGRDAAWLCVDQFAAGHRARRGGHRASGARRAEALRALRCDRRFRCGDRQVALGLGHDASGMERRTAAGPELDARHAQYVDHRRSR